MRRDRPSDPHIDDPHVTGMESSPAGAGRGPTRRERRRAAAAVVPLLVALAIVVVILLV
jgi:hypothetical protein